MCASRRTKYVYMHFFITIVKISKTVVELLWIYYNIVSAKYGNDLHGLQWFAMVYHKPS